MKTLLSLTLSAVAFLALAANLHSQAPAAAPQTPLQILQAMKAKNEDLIGKQTAIDMLTLQKGTYGLGFRVKPEYGGFGHGGSNAGFKCFMHANDRDGVVIMTNGDAGFKLFEGIIGAIVAEYGWQNFKL